MLRCKAKEGSRDPIDLCVLSYDSDSMILKSTECVGTHVPNKCCSKCLRLGQSKALHTDIAKWAMRLGLAKHAQALAVGSKEDRDESKAILVSADYYKIQAVKKQVDEVLALEQEEFRLTFIKRKMESINRSARTERLDDWIRESVMHLSFSRQDDVERQAYRSLCRDFCQSLETGAVSKENLQLAARVVGGKLESNKILQCMVLSFFDMKQRQERQCFDRPCTAKFLDSETLAEVAFTLGVDTKTKTLMRSCGVALKGSAKVDFLSESLPQFFMALDPERLTHNARIAGELLQSTNSRQHFLAVDETCWRPTYSLLAGLEVHNKMSIVGGHWKEGDNVALLHNATDLRDDAKAHLTLHFLLSRTDSSQSAYCLSMLPMPHKATGKSLQFLQMAGAVLNSITAAHDVPPAGIAVDGGTANTAILKAVLGLSKPQELASAPFFDKCSLRKVGGIKFFPFSHLLWGQKYRFAGSLDCLHALKRWAAHAFSGSRTVHFGTSPVYPSGMILGGLPAKAVLGSDQQSDTQALQRMTPTYIAQQADSWGLHVFQLLGALASCGWEASDSLSTETRFENSAAGYYLLLLFLMLAHRNFGNRWAAHWLPLQTTRNLAYVCALSMLLCLEVEGDAPIRGRCFAEKVAEHHFSRVKDGYRGQPSISNGITSTHKVHTQQARQPLKFDKIPKPGPALTANVASALATKTWKQCLTFVTWVEPSLSASDLESTFQLWWASDGVAIMSMNRDAQVDDDGESEEEDDEYNGEEQILKDSLIPDTALEGPKSLQTLMSIEDHIANKAEFCAEVDALADGQLTIQDPPPPIEDAVPADKATEAQACKNFVSEMAACSDVETFCMDIAGTSSCNECIQRQEKLKPMIRKFVLGVRVREKILSNAAITGINKHEKSEWHRLEHQLALARQASLDDGSRQSRSVAWRSVQARCAEAVQGTVQGEGPVFSITHYKPEEMESRQFVVFRDVENAEDANVLQLGIVKCVYRGAVCRKNGVATRKMRATKLSMHPLPCSSVSRILIQSLRKYSEHSFFACIFSPAYLLDPVQHVVGEVRCHSYQAQASKILCSFTAETLEAIGKIQDNPDLMKPMADIPMPIPQPDKESISTEGKIYTCQDFQRSVAGTRNIESWMRRLPHMYQLQGIQLLTDEKKSMSQMPLGKSLRMTGKLSVCGQPTAWTWC